MYQASNIKHQTSSTYIRLRNCVCTKRLSTWMDGQRKPNGCQTNIVVEILNANDDTLPSTGFLSQACLLLKPREELGLIEDIPSIVPKHRYPEPLILRQKAAEISPSVARWRIRGRGRRIFISLRRIIFFVYIRIPGFNWLVGIVWIVDGPDGLRESWRGLMFRRQDDRICLREKSLWPPAAGSCCCGHAAELTRSQPRGLSSCAQCIAGEKYLRAVGIGRDS